MAQPMSLPLTVSCFSKIQIGFTFLVPAYPGNPGQSPERRKMDVCVCVHTRVYVLFSLTHKTSILQPLFQNNLGKPTPFNASRYDRLAVALSEPLNHMEMTCSSLRTDNHTSTSSLKCLQSGIRMLCLVPLPNQQCTHTEIYSYFLLRLDTQLTAICPGLPG